MKKDFIPYLSPFVYEALGSYKYGVGPGYERRKIKQLQTKHHKHTGGIPAGGNSAITHIAKEELLIRLEGLPVKQTATPGQIRNIIIAATPKRSPKTPQAIQHLLVSCNCKTLYP